MPCLSSYLAMLRAPVRFSNRRFTLSIHQLHTHIDVAAAGNITTKGWKDVVRIADSMLEGELRSAGKYRRAVS